MEVKHMNMQGPQPERNTPLEGEQALTLLID